MPETRPILSKQGINLGSITLDGKPTQADWDRALGAYYGPGDVIEKQPSLEEKVASLEKEVDSISLTVQPVPPVKLS